MSRQVEKEVADVRGTAGRPLPYILELLFILPFWEEIKGNINCTWKTDVFFFFGTVHLCNIMSSSPVKGKHSILLAPSKKAIRSRKVNPQLRRTW